MGVGRCSSPAVAPIHLQLFWVERLPQRAPTNQSFASYSSPLTTLLTTILNPAERTPRLCEPNFIRIGSLHAQDIIVQFISQLLEYFGLVTGESARILKRESLMRTGTLAENFTRPVWLEHG